MLVMVANLLILVGAKFCALKLNMADGLCVGKGQESWVGYESRAHDVAHLGMPTSGSWYAPSSRAALPYNSHVLHGSPSLAEVLCGSKPFETPRSIFLGPERQPEILSPLTGMHLLGELSIYCKAVPHSCRCRLEVQNVADQAAQSHPV